MHSQLPTFCHDIACYINAELFMYLLQENNDWVKKCIEYEVGGSRSRCRPKRNCREVLQKDHQARKVNRKNAMDHSRWMKLIKDVNDQESC